LVLSTTWIFVEYFWYVLQKDSNVSRREDQADYLIEALQLEEIETGKGKNQEMGLGRPCETRWGSHSKTVSHVLACTLQSRKFSKGLERSIIVRRLLDLKLC
jgi:hypothetical protein